MNDMEALCFPITKKESLSNGQVDDIVFSITLVHLRGGAIKVDSACYFLCHIITEHVCP